jgi:hypothetical protein
MSAGRNRNSKTKLRKAQRKRARVEAMLKHSRKKYAQRRKKLLAQHRNETWSY